MNLVNIAYIMRGVPGSGKSSHANILAGPDDHIHSTSDYFGHGRNYRFDRSKQKDYHRLNFEAFCRSLRAGIPVVICDNVNAKKWEFANYVTAAEEAGYVVAIVFLPHPHPEVAARRNLHGVPAETIRGIITEWEY